MNSNVRSAFLSSSKSNRASHDHCLACKDSTAMCCHAFRSAVVLEINNHPEYRKFAPRWVLFAESDGRWMSYDGSHADFLSLSSVLALRKNNCWVSESVECVSVLNVADEPYTCRTGSSWLDLHAECTSLSVADTAIKLFNMSCGSSRYLWRLLWSVCVSNIPRVASEKCKFELVPSHHL